MILFDCDLRRRDAAESSDVEGNTDTLLEGPGSFDSCVGVVNGGV